MVNTFRRGLPNLIGSGPQDAQYVFFGAFLLFFIIVVVVDLEWHHKPLNDGRAGHICRSLIAINSNFQRKRRNNLLCCNLGGWRRVVVVVGGFRGGSPDAPAWPSETFEDS